MKRTLALLLACALGLGLLAGCSGKSDPTYGPGDSSFTPPPLEPFADLVSQAFLPASSPRVEEALASFGLELLKQTRAANGVKAMESEIDHVPFSTLVSPFSAAMALSMTANGADGNTLAQFQEVLGGEADMDEINAAWAQLVGDYHALGGSTQLTIANSLWEDFQGRIYEEFASKCQGGYGAHIFTANLSDLRIVDDLNGWVSEHTNKMIPSIISEPFPEETACLLVNALYLKNQWLREFDPLCTRQMDFHHAGGPDSHPDYLQHFDTELSYLRGEGAQGAVLPYDDGRLAFFALLPDLYPDCDYNFGEWLHGLDGESLSQLINTREDAMFLRFAMPKFRAESIWELEKILPELGLTDAFVPGTADFSNMGGNPYGYYINQVIHAARIEVNEKGTEAAAATVVAESGGAAPPSEGITLVLDRPFLYGIVDLYTGVPLFLGTYE